MQTGGTMARQLAGRFSVPPVDIFVRRSNLESKPDGQLVRPFRNNAIGGSMTENPPQFDKMTE
jgi:hypothetical protein